jgi:pseudoazurin
MRHRWLACGCVLGLAVACALPHEGLGKEVEVKTLNRAPTGVFAFSPELVRIDPGDTVAFVAADKGHEVHSVAGMIPAGAQPFTAPMSQDLKVTLTVPGVYVITCKPHMFMGMVGLVVVGDPVNLGTLDPGALSGKARAKLESLLAAVRKG